MRSFKPGQIVYILPFVEHPLRGYDGEVITASNDTVWLKIRHMVPGEQPFDLVWDTSVVQLPTKDVELLAPDDEPAYDTLKEFVEKWNLFLDEE